MLLLALGVLVEVAGAVLGPPALPLANTTSTAFDSRVSPPGPWKVACYRIPMVVQAKGRLVAFAEGRIGRPRSPDRSRGYVPSCSDCVVNGIAQRISTDGGRTWGPYAWAVPPNSTDPRRPDFDIGGNPSAVATADGTLILQFVRGLRRKKTQAQTCNPALSNWQQQSSDGGRTWSSPRDISRFLGPWAGSLVGPANGIQLQHSAAHKGRLVWCGHWGVYNSTQVWYSDDGGATYALSATVFAHMDECAVAELEDGSVYLNMRNNHYSACDCRASAVSADGAATFGPRAFDAALVSPVCQATLSTAGGAGLFFANPASAHERADGMIKKSLDGGRTWPRSLAVTPPGLGPVEGGSFDYSCLLPDPLANSPTEGGLLWSHNTGGNWLALFSRFPLDF